MPKDAGRIHTAAPEVSDLNIIVPLGVSGIKRVWHQCIVPDKSCISGGGVLDNGTTTL
jgi:hypothetical protein